MMGLSKEWIDSSITKIVEYLRDNPLDLFENNEFLNAKVLKIKKIVK